MSSQDGTIITSEIGWDERGLVSLSNEGITNGTVTVSYRKTITQYIGEILTLASVCSLMVYAGKKKYKRASMMHKQ